MNRKKITECMSACRTPFYIYDFDQLRKDISGIRSALEGKADLCFSVKSNPFLAKTAAPLTDRIEICSFGEYEICRKLGIPAEKYVLSGVLKEEKDLLRALTETEGKSIYTVESVQQYCTYTKWSSENRIPIRLLLRLSGGNQFGMDLEDIRKILRIRSLCPCIEILGLHYFSGTQKHNTAVYEKELGMLDGCLLSLEKEFGMTFSELEYGAGIPVCYFREQDPEIRENYLRSLSDQIGRMTWKGRITAEMGRAIAAGCGGYITSVRDIKCTEGVNYCIVDGGIHQLHYDGQMRGMLHPFTETVPDRGKEKKWAVCGCLCTANDILCNGQDLGDLKTGDAIVFQNTGAYSALEGMSLFLSHDLPAIIGYSEEKGVEILRNAGPTWTLNCGEDGTGCVREAAG